MLLGVSIQNFALLTEFSLGLVADDVGAERLSEIGVSRFPLRKLSGIIGRNNSGKSFLFEGLDFLADCLRFNVPYAATLHGRGGFNRLHTLGKHENMVFELLMVAPWQDELLSYRLELSVDAYGRPEVESELAQSLAVSAALAERLQCCRAHASSDETLEAAFTPLLELRSGHAKLYSEGQTESTEFGDCKCPALASYGKMLKYKELRSLYNFISGFFLLRENKGAASAKESMAQFEQGGHRHINAYATNVRNVLAYLKNEDHRAFRALMDRIEAHIPKSQRVGDLLLDRGLVNGEAKLFILLLLLQDPKPRPLIMLDNPDVLLYHEMVEALGTAFREYALRANTSQLLFSTHSSILLESLNPYEVWVLKRERSDMPRSYMQMLEAITPAGPLGQDGPPPLRLAAEEAAQVGFEGARADFVDGTKASCIADSAVVRAMYREGVGLGALWYSGHFDSDGEN